MEKQQLDKVIRKHGLWLVDSKEGERANLSYADLHYANLRSADLHYAENIILGPQRTDGYQFFLINQKFSWHVIAGCRDMTIKQYREHVRLYGDAAKESETVAILDYLEVRLGQYKEPK